MASPGEKNVSAYVEPEVAEAFSKQVESRGQLKRRAVEGALRMWLTLSPQEQVGWIQGKTTQTTGDLDDDIRDLAVRFARLTEKLESRDSTKSQKKTR